jgi:TrmH family RNA methyltransferase
MIVTSLHNPKIQYVRSLLSRRQRRQGEDACVVEGVRLNEEALAAGWTPRLVLFSPQLTERGRQIVAEYARRQVETLEISSDLMKKIGETETPQGLLGIFPRQFLSLPEQLDFVLIADVVRDPGNLGALLRSAAAAGVQAVFLTPGTTDAFAPKVLRAGMGAHFRLPIHSLGWEQLPELLKSHSRPPAKIYLAEAGRGAAYWQVDLTQPLALVVGGEAEGASPDARQAADGSITIPMPGKSESLNAAIAASILLFEVVRQRSQ